MASKVDGRRHIFDVIKVNMFGVRQPRLVVIERPGPGRPGGVQICTANGKVKRALELSEVSGVEDIPHGKDPADADRSVLFKFHENSSKVTKRQLMFVSKKQRDAFVDELELLDSKFVQHRKDSSVGATSDRAKKVEELKRFAESERKSTRLSGAMSAIPLVESSSEDDVKFFCLEANEWGFQEPRVLCFSDDERELQAVDARANGSNHSDWPLRRLAHVEEHAGDKCLACLHFTDGALVNARVVKKMYLTFSTKFQRDRFLFECRARVERLVPRAAVTTDANWQAALPIHAFDRFEAYRVKKGRHPVVMMLSASQQRIYILRTKDIPDYSAGDAIPSNVIAEEALSVVGSRAQITKHTKNLRTLSISFERGVTMPADRDAMEFEFADPGDRDRFCACVATMCAMSPGSRPASMRVGPSAGVDCELSNPYALMPSFMDVSRLWASSWPSDKMKIWIGTYNVSGSTPPGEGELDKWILPPSRDPDGPRELYVFGLQELGANANREAWLAALMKHIGCENPSSGAVERLEKVPYIFLEGIHMWEMAIWAFVRKDHLSDISSVIRAELPTGLAVAKAITGVQLGNKGAVAISFRWRESTFAFVNCHLPARPDVIRLKKRETTYKTIARKLKLETVLADVDWLHQHDHIWMLGDMNYRVDLPFDRCVTLYNQRNFGAIVAHDQLRREQERQRVFNAFCEARIEFAPTYRWQKKVQDFSWKRGQAPSYTDRILHRSLPGAADAITWETYYSTTGLFGSDHRAVGSTFGIALRKYYASPTRPLVHLPLRVPTLFSSLDCTEMPVPVLLLSDLKFVNVKAVAAPAAVNAIMYGTWFLGTSEIKLPTISSSGLTRAERDELRALRVTLLEESKRKIQKIKAELREAKTKAKTVKKEAKAKGEKTGPKVAINPLPESAAITGSTRPMSMSIARTASFSVTRRSELSMESSRASLDGELDVTEVDADSDEDEDDLEDDETTAASNEYEILEEDVQYAQAALATMEDAASDDAVRSDLLRRTVSYSWSAFENSIPAMRPSCWDPRILSKQHIFISINALPGPDGAMLAMGNDSGKSASASGDAKSNSVGFAALSVAPAIQAASAALTAALDVQRDDDEVPSEAADTVSPLVGPGRGSRSASMDWSKKTAATDANELDVVEYERIAKSHGYISGNMTSFSKLYNLDGIPWYLTAPAVSFAVDIESAGQVVGQLTGSYALRAHIDPVVTARGAHSAQFRPQSCRWNLDGVMAALEAAQPAAEMGPEASTTGMHQSEAPAHAANGSVGQPIPAVTPDLSSSSAIVASLLASPIPVRAGTEGGALPSPPPLLTVDMSKLPPPPSTNTQISLSPEVTAPTLPAHSQPHAIFQPPPAQIRPSTLLPPPPSGGVGPKQVPRPETLADLMTPSAVMSAPPPVATAKIESVPSHSPAGSLHLPPPPVTSISPPIVNLPPPPKVVVANHNVGPPQLPLPDGKGLLLPAPIRSDGGFNEVVKRFPPPPPLAPPLPAVTAEYQSFFEAQFGKKFPSGFSKSPRSAADIDAAKIPLPPPPPGRPPSPESGDGGDSSSDDAMDELEYLIPPPPPPPGTSTSSTAPQSGRKTVSGAELLRRAHDRAAKISMAVKESRKSGHISLTGVLTLDLSGVAPPVVPDHLPPPPAWSPGPPPVISPPPPTAAATTAPVKVGTQHGGPAQQSGVVLPPPATLEPRQQLPGPPVKNPAMLPSTLPPAPGSSIPVMSTSAPMGKQQVAPPPKVAPPPSGGGLPPPPPC